MKTYEEHYSKCIENYNSSGSSAISSVTLEKNCIVIDETVLKTVSNSVKKSLLNKHDISESLWGTYVNDFSAIDNLETLCRSVVDQLEEKYFKSFVKIENLHILQNKTEVPLESSWVWHYDDCPKEFLKFAIYLNKVTDKSGPMQIVKAKESTPVIESFRDHPNAIKGSPPPVFPKSRVPSKFVDTILSSGGEISSLTGPPGTHFLFTPNIIHRGTAPSPGTEPRLAIFMFVRPSLKRIDNLIDSAKPKKANVNVKKYELN